MARRISKLAIAVGCIAVLVSVVLLRDRVGTAAPREDLKPFAHWVFNAQGVQNGKVADVTNALPGSILGKPKLIDKPTEAIELTSMNEYVMVKKTVTPKDAFLPKSKMTIAAWARIDTPTEWGGILSCLQDNGNDEAGVILGYNNSKFYFGLASQKTVRKSGFGTLTILESKANYELGRWYHLAATYDGTTMKLFVNGQPVAESKDQSGDVLYAPSAPFVLGRYQDVNEDYAMNGAIKEILWTAQTATPEQIAAHFQADAALAAIPAPVQPARFVIEPYLQFATRTSMTIMCETATETNCEVFYGTTFAMDKSAKPTKAGTLHEVPLTNLNPKTKYFYKVVCTDAEGKKLTSKPSTFLTAVDATDAYSFAVIGDTQRNPIITGKVAKLMWERRPNFAIHLGDVVDNGASKVQWTDDLFKPAQELFSRVPVYPTIGNHEKNHAHYYKYFALPKPEYYYSFKYGNAEFFVLDTNKSVDATTEQYKWIEKALAASDAKWKICYHHHPLYTSDSDDYGDTFKGSTTHGAPRHKLLIELYEKNNVDIVMNGHIHLYERTYPVRAGKVDRKKGITYITSGGGGGRLEAFEPTPAFFKNFGLVDYHYCYFTVHDGNLECKVFDHENRLFDQFEMKKD